MIAWPIEIGSGRRHLKMLRAVNDVELRPTQSEEAALAHEAELLKTLKPKFNRAGGSWVGAPRRIIWRVSANRFVLQNRDRRSRIPRVVFLWAHRWKLRNSGDPNSSIMVWNLSGARARADALWMVCRKVCHWGYDSNHPRRIRSLQRGCHEPKTIICRRP